MMHILPKTNTLYPPMTHNPNYFLSNYFIKCHKMAALIPSLTSCLSPCVGEEPSNGNGYILVTFHFKISFNR